MNLISIDLGTTNIKAAVYDHKLQLIDLFSIPVEYSREKDFVEFDAEQYFTDISLIIQKAAARALEQNGAPVAQIVLTGQAESLILLDQDKKPVRPGISWLDMRSSGECEELSRVFSPETCYQITGQPELIPTWPITKILWIKKNQPDIFQNTAYFLLLKDYIIYRLCGNLIGDHSIYCFSHYFDINKKKYWKEILDYCEVKVCQLPKLMPSGSIAGYLKGEFAVPGTGLTPSTKINIGTLDHFASMIGTGNIHERQINESAGTVLSIAALTPSPILNNGKLPNYCGPFPDSYVLLPVCESGGFSMEWFKKQFMEEISYSRLNEILKARKDTCPPLFLPYLTGVNPPDYNENASGVFFGLRADHDKYDLALGIMQGVACILRKNLEHMKACGIQIDKIISTGGGARSAVWTQIKADITGHIIEVPENEEAPCLGAAIMAAVQENMYASYEEAIAACVSIGHTYLPSGNKYSEQTYQLFCRLYTSLGECFCLNRQRELL